MAVAWGRGALCAAGEGGVRAVPKVMAARAGVGGAGAGPADRGGGGGGLRFATWAGGWARAPLSGRPPHRARSPAPLARVEIACPLLRPPLNGYARAQPPALRSARHPRTP